MVTKEEITKGLMKILNTHGNLEKPKHTWSTITEVPTPKIHKPEAQIEEQQLNYLFEKYDTNKSGYLDKDEIVDFVNEYMKILGKNHQFNKQQNEILISWIDKNHDRKISK